MPEAQVALRRQYLQEILSKVPITSTVRYRHHISVTDDVPFQAMAELARREGTTLSACIENLVRLSMESMDSPQTSLDLYQKDAQIPPLTADDSAWKLYLAQLSPDALKEVGDRINRIVTLHNKQGDVNWHQGRYNTL